MDFLSRNYFTRVFPLLLCTAVTAWALANTNLAEAFSVLSGSSAIAQDKGKEIHLEGFFAPSGLDKKSPLGVESIKVDEIDGDDIQLGKKSIGKKFMGRDNKLWLKQTTLRLLNTSSKPITYAQINIDFPEILSAGIMMQHQVFVGHHPVYKTTVKRKSIRVLPGEKMEVPLALEYENINHTLEFIQRPVSDITRIVVRLSEIGFEDDTLYSGGSLYRKNPESNGQPKWLIIVE
jgi:hypothetical protein